MSTKRQNVDFSIAMEREKKECKEKERKRKKSINNNNNKKTHHFPVRRMGEP